MPIPARQLLLLAIYAFRWGFPAASVSCPSRTLSPVAPCTCILGWQSFGIWIRIQEGKNDPQNCDKSRRKLTNFTFWSAGCSLMRAKSFSCSLDVLLGGLGISKFQFLIKKNIKCTWMLFAATNCLRIPRCGIPADSVPAGVWVSISESEFKNI